jgi:hypothetical protein
MSSRPTSIARVSLARSLPRLLVVPVMAVMAGISAAGAGVLMGGLPGVGLAIAGVCALGSGSLLAVILLSLRLEVEVAAIRVRWWGGERRYPLARGSVTRMAARGANAPRVRVRFGALGWGFGPGLLRENERIEIVRLAPEARLILLPTARGRLAVAPAVEQELLDALTAAARVQQRLDAAGTPAQRAVDRPSSSAAQPVLQRAIPEPAAARPPPVGPPVMDLPRPLTGIERAQLEGRLAVERERRMAEAARRAELELAAQREREETAAAHVMAEPMSAREAIPRARRRERARWRPPAWLRRPPTGAPLTEAAAPQPSSSEAAALARPRSALRLPSLAAAAVMLLPSLAAAVLWLAVGAWLAPTATEMRQIVMALVLAGPAATAASLVTWFVAPRLSGLPLIAGAAALVLVGRALLP